MASSAILSIDCFVSLLAGLVHSLPIPSSAGGRAARRRRPPVPPGIASIWQTGIPTTLLSTVAMCARIGRVSPSSPRTNQGKTVAIRTNAESPSHKCNLRGTDESSRHLVFASWQSLNRSGPTGGLAGDVRGESGSSAANASVEYRHRGCEQLILSFAGPFGVLRPPLQPRRSTSSSSRGRGARERCGVAWRCPLQRTR